MDAAPNVQIDFRGYNAGSLFRFLPRSTDFSSAGGPASPAASLPSPQCAALSTAHGIISKLASELDQHSLGSISLTHGADDLDARGRSPMCRQSSRPSLGREKPGVAPSASSRLHFLRAVPILHDEAGVVRSSTVQGDGKRRFYIAAKLESALRSSANRR
jgi:hypothetical protein